MKLKTIASTLLAFGLVCATQAQAAPWTFTASGTIASGWDNSNWFSGGNMAGKTYSITFTLDPTLYATQYLDATQHYGNGTNSGPVTELITVGGVTRSFTLDLTKSNFGQSTLVWDPTGAGWGMLQQQQNGFLADNSVMETTQTIGSGPRPTLSFDQSYSYTYQVGTGDWASGGIRVRDTILTTNVLSIAINAPAQGGAVPEPASLALLGLGLVGLLAKRRKVA